MCKDSVRSRKNIISSKMQFVPMVRQGAPVLQPFESLRVFDSSENNEEIKSIILKGIVYVISKNR